MTRPASLPGSFRDPSGFLFRRDGVLHRFVSPCYGEHYDRLMGSGLYAELLEAGRLVPHEEVSPGEPGAHRVLRPAPVPFVSYPYEWCFGQLKSAALATLEIQMAALARGMTLKDASAYNVQFLAGRPVLIDSLSFEVRREGAPWVAYQQFCRHFLAPLALMAKRDVRLGRLLAVHIDGVPLDLASALLPWRTWLRFSLLAHVHLHARSLKAHAHRDPFPRRGRLSRTALLGLADSLRAGIEALDWRPEGTEWADYDDHTSYSEESRAHKAEVVRSLLQDLPTGVLWDLGANTGAYSRMAAEMGHRVVSFDLDPAAVELNWRACVARRETRILPLLMDLTNPSPALGWEHRERDSLAGRGPADTALGLALVHHLALSNNVPLERVAAFLARICRHLIIEFVPKEDAQVRRLLASRADIFRNYHLEGFEQAFAACFRIRRREAIRGSSRTVYSMEASSSP